MGHTTFRKNLLDDSARFASNFLSSTQIEMDSAYFRFHQQAGDPFFFSALAFSQMTKRGFDFFFGTVFRSALETSTLLRPVAMGLHQSSRLFAETFSFEWGLRRMKVSFADANPQILSWQGEQGLGRGLVTSGLSFLALHSLGKFSAGENLIFQHSLQSAGMVGIHEISSRIGISTSSALPLVGKILEAAAFNLQQQGMAQVISFRPSAQEVFLPAPKFQKQWLASKRTSIARFASEEKAHADDFSRLHALHTEQYQQALLKAEQAAISFVEHYNLRLSTVGERPFPLEAATQRQLETSFDEVIVALEKMRSFQSEFSTLLFRGGRGEIKRSKSLALQREMDAKIRELEKKLQDWNEDLVPALNTLSLSMDDHTRVLWAIEEYFKPDQPSDALQVLPLRKTPSMQDHFDYDAAIRSLPEPLSERVSHYQRGFSSEASTLNFLIHRAALEYVRVANEWLLNPAKSLSSSLENWDAMLADAKTTLSFIRLRQLSDEEILFQFRSAGLRIPGWYERLRKQNQDALRYGSQLVDILASRLDPLLSGTQLKPADYQTIQTSLNLLNLKIQGIPILSRYPNH